MLDSYPAERLATQTIADLLGGDTEPNAKLLAAALREMLVRIDTVCSITGLSTQSVYRLMSQGNFPHPIKITTHARAWRLSEIMHWIDSRPRVRARASAPE
jgi:prophage regulatory protein